MINWLLTHTPLLYFTQSIWRDEAFSIFVAQRPLSFIFTSLGFEPPLYYALLHFWVKIFGTGEIAARSLSLLGFSLATVIVILWSEKLFKTTWLQIVVPILFFFNPMLLYYAFEVRTYGWYILFAVLSMYSYFNKKWLWYVLSSVLGFYTHVYLAFFLLANAVHWVITTKFFKKFSFKKFLRDPMVRSSAAIGVLALPWIYKIIHESSRLKSSWYFPVDLQLVWSGLGNMFLGYEGTPWHLWDDTARLSAVLLAAVAIALFSSATRKRAFYFVLFGLLPLALVIGVSFIKPLFVNRYLIPATCALVFIVGMAIESLSKRPVIQRTLAALAIGGILLFNLWYPDKHAKLAIRDTLTQINMLKNSDDVVLAASPLIFFESIYYSTDPERVFLYNPDGTTFPWYVGDAIVTPSQMVREFPPDPIRAFLVQEDGTFEIVYNMGEVRP